MWAEDIDNRRLARSATALGATKRKLFQNKNSRESGNIELVSHFNHDAYGHGLVHVVVYLWK